MNQRRAQGRHLLATVLLAGFTQVASASIMVELDSVTYISSGIFAGNYRWSYAATATATDGFISGGNAYFTIYDLPGNLVTVEAPLYWNASSQNTGVTPVGLTPTDDPNIRNVTFRYGSLASRPGDDAIAANSTFDIILSTGSPAYGEFSWQDYSAYPVSQGVLQSGLGTVGGGDNTVPEPGTLGLLGLVLAGLTVSRRRSR